MPGIPEIKHLNFFAHYHFYHQSGNSWFNAGLLFPDLLRNFTGNQRIKPKATLNYLNEEESLTMLVKGIRLHFEADDKFHNWAWFIQKNEELALTIRHSGLAFKRDWFLAHILIELAIDHVLVQEKKEEIVRLYHDLKSCGKPTWENFFKQNNLNDFELWHHTLLRFIEHRYIFSYVDLESVCYALNRIYLSTGIGKFDHHQNEYLIVLLNTFIPELNLKIKELQTILE